MILEKQFIKSIPVGYKEKVLDKLQKFEEQLLECENKIRELPAGYWVRMIKNTNIFKFRLSNKDRILFTYIKKRKPKGNFKSDVVFLQYVTHDEQVRVSKNMNIDNIESKLIEIDNNDYGEDCESNIDDYAYKYCTNGTIDMNYISSIVVNPEELVQISEENYEDYLYYLSDEQYNILSEMKNSVLLSGAAGTGKTVLLLNLLMAAKEYKQKALYVTYNELLLDSIKEKYDKFIDSTEEYCDFFSIRSLEDKLIQDKGSKIVKNTDISKWISENINKYKLLRKMDLYQVVTELNGIIKGYMGIEFNEVGDGESKMITLEKYLNIPKQYSGFNEDEKREMYKLSVEYNKWLTLNDFEDENDICRRILKNQLVKDEYQWVIVDEVQDLSEVQILLISKLVKENGHIIWAGDVNQTINPTFFSYGRLKSLYYNNNINLDNFMLTNNYRSTEEIVNFVNEIIKDKCKLISKNDYDKEQTAIRKGAKPDILKFDTSDLKLLIDSLSNRHYCALVVPNEQLKKLIIETYPEVEDRIFIVHEIKGLEYENIICYNILSAYKLIWNRILNKEYKNNEYMKYYFNLLYVAASRAKDRLCFYEENLTELDFVPFKQCNIVDNFNEEELGLLKESSKIEWKQEAERLEKAGQEDRAKLIRDLKLEDKIKSVNAHSDKRIKELYSNVSRDIDCKNELDQLMKAGIIEYRSRNYSKALEIFNELLEKYPEEADLNYNIANCYSYMTGGMEYSLRYYWKAININPKRYEYYLDMAAILKTLGMYDVAIDILEAAQTIFPQYGNANEMKALIYKDKNQYEKFRKYYNMSNELPKYTFDSYNKIWKKPDEKVKENLPQVEDEDKPIEISLPRGIEYLKLEDGLDRCGTDIEFKEVNYNKKSKRYNIILDKEMCDLCENNEECIYSFSDKNNKISIKKSIIKKVEEINRTKIKKEKMKKTEVENSEELSDIEIKSVILRLKDKYGDNFDSLEEADINEMTESQKIIKTQTNTIMQETDIIEQRKVIEKMEKCYWFQKYANTNRLAYMYGINNEFGKAIKLYTTIMNEYFEKGMNELKKKVGWESLKIIYSPNNEFENFEEFRLSLLAELHSNCGKMYLNQNQVTKAAILLKKAIELSPEKYTNSYLVLGDIYVEMGKLKEAEESYRKALALGNPLGQKGLERLEYMGM